MTVPASSKADPDTSSPPRGTPPAELARDRPDAYIPRDRRWALHAGTTLPDRVRGSALFADISGFTPLTEALARELGPQRGAEELTVNIGRVFHAVIGELDAYDGNVIYFAGDAITCWIDGDDGTRACAAAMGMQQAIERTGTIVTPGGAEVRLAMKVAVAVGEARRFVVGDPDIQLIDVLAGRLMDDLAEAEHHSQKGEIVLEPSAVAALGGRVTVSDFREDEATGRTFAVLRQLLVDVDRQPVRQPEPLPEDLVRPWLLPPVYERMRTGRGEFLTELRPAIPVFLRFGGIDYDHDDEAIDKLDTFVRAAQRIMSGYGGNVLQLTLGDKGAYLYGVFGSPVAHEDDAARSAAAALELRDLEKTTAARDIQIGMTEGRLRSGTYGHEMRRTFVCLGDAVNLAARLMSAAPRQGIYVAGVVREAAGEAFIWQRLPDLTVKGKAEPVEAWSLDGSLERASRRKTRFELGLVGRQRELAELDLRLREAAGGQGRIVGISAEAGMGKSRLVAEFVRNVRRSGRLVVFGECQAYGTKTPYFVWREIWRRLFGLDDDQSDERQIAALELRLAAIAPGLVARAPLLSEVVGLSIPDTDLTKGFDAKLRKTSLADLLAVCLRARAGESPFVAVLEDCHWIDELSRDLLVGLTRAASTLPVLFVLAYRPAAEPGGDLGVERHAGFSELALDDMEPAEIAQLARSKMEQLVGGDAAVSDALVDLVAARSDGNPFYVEELLNYIVAQGVDASDPEAMKTIQLPESLHTLVLSRIDAAAEGPRRTMKVASVVGRVFEAPVLPGAYDELGSLATVLDDLDALRTLDLVALDREAAQTWMFKHMVTQEVAYESLPFALREVLHGRVADYIERTEADDLDRVVSLLEYHYWRSDHEAKKREYLRRAADAAQASYANNAAIAYLDRLIPLLEGGERIEQTIKLAQVLQLTGDVVRAIRIATDARERAVEIGDAASAARCDHSLAESARRLGRFDEATERLEVAATTFASLGDEAGAGRVLHLAGTVAAQRGDYPTARAKYGQSLVIRQRHQDMDQIARLLANLAIVAEYEGDFAESRRLNLEALTIRESLGDRWAIAMSHNNLGMIAFHERRFEEAKDRFDESTRLGREVGDPWVIAMADENLGNARMGLGDYAGAKTDYASALRAFMALGDSYYSAFLLERVAILAAAVGDHVGALELSGAADRLRDEIGAGRAPSLVEEIERGLQPARAALDARAGEAAIRRGRQLDLASAVELALQVCSAP
jgi:class 3 adenylate cyclase/tetratricopeptide (TPR) repeat protein